MKYALIRGSYSIDGESHIGYGICSTEDSTLLFEDLTVDPIAAARLVKLCNDSDLSPVHLKGVVEDFVIASSEE